MSRRILTVVTALGGGGVGGTLYFLTSNGASVTTTQAESSTIGTINQVSLDDTSREPKTVAKGKCQVISLLEEGEKLLNEKHKNKEEYLSVSCSNTNVKDSYIKLPLKWTGLFPKFVLSERIKPEVGVAFEMMTQVEQTEGNFGSRMEATFSGEGLKNSVTGTWESIEKTNITTEIKDELVFVTFQGNKLIYLFLPPISQTERISN